LLFLIYINDLPDEMNIKLPCKLYADDSKVFCRLRRKKAVEDAALLQEDIDRIVSWCELWLMRLNIEKCKVMHIGKGNPRKMYYMRDPDSGIVHELATTEKERDLGVIVSSNLKSRNQIDHVVSKANSLLGRLKKTFMHRGVGLWRRLYITYVRPQLEFAVSAWNPYQKRDIRKIEGVQHRAVMIAHHMRYIQVSESMKNRKYEERLKRLKLTTLEDRRLRGDLIQLYKLNRGIEEVIWEEKLRLGHPRKGENGKFIIENKPGCLQRLKFFSNRATEAWNKLPESVKGATSVDSFKKLLDGHCKGCHCSSRALDELRVI
jgi:ribonucleases P/MRP protein subunit RPP40